MNFLVWVYTSQDFAQTQQNFARSHDRMTVTFRNSGWSPVNSLFGNKGIMKIKENLDMGGKKITK